MKKALVVDVHSVLDVITNSSSELFVISDNTTVSAVEDLLKYMVDTWNEMADKGIFGKWHQDRETLKYENCMGVRLMDPSDINIGEDAKYSWGYETEENVGKIIIESTTDNSIPWEIIEWIESAFSSKRWHLG
jgi:hypothetical protein